MSVHAIEEIVKKLDEAFGHSDLEAVLGFYEDDAILVADAAWARTRLRCAQHRAD